MKVGNEYPPPRLPLCGIETLAPFITVRDVQEYTHKSLATIRKQCRAGQIRATKKSGRWLIDRDSVLKEMKTNADKKAAQGA